MNPAHDYGHSSYGHSAPYRGGYGYRHNGNGTAAAMGVGIQRELAFALATQSNGSNGCYERGYYAAPPPRAAGIAAAKRQLYPAKTTERTPRRLSRRPSLARSAQFYPADEITS